EDAADDEPADVVVPVEHGAAELKPGARLEARRRDRGQDGLEQGLEGAPGLGELGGGGARPGIRVEDGELELVLGRFQVDEEIVDLVERSEERRVGKECRIGSSSDHLKKRKTKTGTDYSAHCISCA